MNVFPHPHLRPLVPDCSRHDGAEVQGLSCDIPSLENLQHKMLWSPLTGTMETVYTQVCLKELSVARLCRPTNNQQWRSDPYMSV